MDTCKAANLYAAHPAEFMAYVNPPIGEGRRVPGAVKPHIACPTTSGTGSETTGIAIFALKVAEREDRHRLAQADPDDRADRSRGDALAAAGRDRGDRLRLHEPRARVAHRARVHAPAQSREGRAAPGVAGGNAFSDMLATESLKLVGQFLERAVRDASDVEARTEMMYAAMLSGIAFNAAGCHLPHGLSYSVSAQTRNWHVPGYPEGKDAGAARHGGRAQQSVGVAPHGARESRAAPALRGEPRRRRARCRSRATRASRSRSASSR
jgi:hypothetical protein